MVCSGFEPGAAGRYHGAMAATHNSVCYFIILRLDNNIDFGFLYS